MTPDRWQNVLGQIKDNFEVLSKENSRDPESGSTVETVVFISPAGKVMLEFIARPILLETKTKYSNRIGSDVKIEKVYSQDDFSYSLEAWRFDEDNQDWLPITGEAFIN